MICDVACWKGILNDGNFEFNIYSGRAFSKLQNGTLFIEIDQCIAIMCYIEYCLKFFEFFIICCLFCEKIVPQSPPFNVLHHILYMYIVQVVTPKFSWMFIILAAILLD